MNEVYFVVELLDGKTLDFDKECNYVNYNDADMCIFQREYTEGIRRYKTLAIIPKSRILTILRKE